MRSGGVLGWGVVGIGGFLQDTIAPAIHADPRSELVAAVSRDAGRVARFGDRFDVPHRFTSYDAMLADTRVDAVYIATPNSLHADQVVAAAGAGKHVFCEKPLATNVADARRAVDACAAAGVFLGIDFHNRFLPWVHDVTAMVGAGQIGEITTVEVDVGSGTRHYDNWRADPELSGLGSVHNVGTHVLDALRVILDSEPIEVTAMFDMAPGGGQVELLAMILMRFANGALVFCNCNETVPNPTNRIAIHGTSGRIVGTGLVRSRIDGDLTVVTPDGESKRHYPAPQAHRLCLSAFTESILAGRQPTPSGHDGLRSAQVCAAIERAARERRIVTVEGAVA